MSKTPVVLILAAGLGTRMKSRKAKVLHEVAGRPLIVWAVESARDAGAEDVVAILGHQSDDVAAVLDARYGKGKVRVALQPEQKGTGHAVLCALPTIENEPDDRIVVILTGDAPLFRAERVAELVEACRTSESGMAMVSTHPTRDVAYGRLLRDDAGKLLRIVEHRDATEEQRAIREMNAGFYAIELGHLRSGVRNLDSDNAQGELYLTDLAENAAERGGAAVIDAPFEEVSGINSRIDLAAVTAVARRRINDGWMGQGVTMVAPDQTFIEADAGPFGQDVTLGPGVCIRGKSSVADGAIIDTGCVLENATIGPDVRVRPHCYLGDVTVGANAEIGAGTITANHDGFTRHKTVIEAGAFVGSDSQLIAPVTVGRDAYVGAGSTATRDVPRSSLALSRTKQVNVDGWAGRFREAQGKRDKKR